MNKRPRPCLFQNGALMVENENGLLPSFYALLTMLGVVRPPTDLCKPKYFSCELTDLCVQFMSDLLTVLQNLRAVKVRAAVNDLQFRFSRIACFLTEVCSAVPTPFLGKLFVL